MIIQNEPLEIDFIECQTVVNRIKNAAGTRGKDWHIDDLRKFERSVHRMNAQTVASFIGRCMRGG